MNMSVLSGSRAGSAMRGLLRHLAAALVLLLVAAAPASASAAQTSQPGVITFRDVSLQLSGDGWQQIESQTTPGVAPTATSYTRTLNAHKFVFALYEIQAGTDAQVLGRDALV